MRVECAVIGSGNIGTDLMYKLLRSSILEMRVLIGIDPESEGLRLARSLGVETTASGSSWLVEHSTHEVRLVFDATSAKVHAQQAPLLREAGITAIDLTPAAVGPAVVPAVNLKQHLNEPNINLITCGGQATTPIVAAVTRVCDVMYAETISTIASQSAGPGTRQNIDEFTQRTAQGLETIGGAEVGKAIIVLNPAEPPIIMRNTVYCTLPDGADRKSVTRSIEEMVAEVASYVPGYRLKRDLVFDDGPFSTPGGVAAGRVTVLLEVEGAGEYLSLYAGNLDIMTAAAVRVGEMLATRCERAGVSA